MLGDECNRLWQEYLDERKAYMKILEQIQQATIQWNSRF
jgi:hypothetical protein